MFISILTGSRYAVVSPSTCLEKGVPYQIWLDFNRYRRDRLSPDVSLLIDSVSFWATYLYRKLVFCNLLCLSPNWTLYYPILHGYIIWKPLPLSKLGNITWLMCRSLFRKGPLMKQWFLGGLPKWPPLETMIPGWAFRHLVVYSFDMWNVNSGGGVVSPNHPCLDNIWRQTSGMNMAHK